MRRCARARRDGSISRERRSSSGGRKEDGRSPTLRGISQDEHESITCSSRLTFILGLANERIPSFQFVLLFPLQSSGGTSVPHIPLLVARWSSPLPGPICFSYPHTPASASSTNAYHRRRVIGKKVCPEPNRNPCDKGRLHAGHSIAQQCPSAPPLHLFR